MRHVAALLLMSALAVAAKAEKKPSASPAPIPPAIATARTAFLSNRCEEKFPFCAELYNTLYAGLQMQDHFQLVSSPGEADLVIELHYDISRIKLEFIDRPSHYVLWTSSGPILLKNGDDTSTMALLLQDIEMVATTGAKASVDRSKRQYR